MLTWLVHQDDGAIEQRGAEALGEEDGIGPVGGGLNRLASRGLPPRLEIQCPEQAGPDIHPLVMRLGGL